MEVILVVFLAVIGASQGLSNKYFPKDFLFGIGTNAYQAEGAWNEDGKGENIWDHVCHTQPDFVLDKSNADVTSDCYHKVDEDIKNMKYLGVKFYRFGIAWTRIMPTGFPNEVNQKGIDYYNTLINKLIANGIEPHATLYHNDMPQPLQLLGGWTNSIAVDYFTDYVRVVFENFGDRVKYWTTTNDAVTCVAPALHGQAGSEGIAEYLCIHNLIKGHASVYHLYDKEFRATQRGKISTIIYTLTWFEPGSNKTEDIEAAERCKQFNYGILAHPLVHGDYPKIVKDRVAERSKMEGFPRSRLPEFTKEEIEYIKGSYDYLAMNHYTTVYVVNENENPVDWRPSFWTDKRIRDYYDPSWPETGSSWIRENPDGFRKVLAWMKKEYNNPEIFITESGCADRGTTDDSDRIRFMTNYLSAVLDAIHIDKVNVTGFSAWALVDNFEWDKGFTEKFGLYHVDFNDPNRPRTPKKSVEFYKNVVAKRCLVDQCVD